MEVKDTTLKTMGEIFQEVERKRREWRSTLRLGDIRYCRKHKCIVIEGAGCGYDIPLERLSTPEEAFHWLCHLHAKSWFSAQMHKDLLEVMERVTSVNEYCGSW